MTKCFKRLLPPLSWSSLSCTAPDTPKVYPKLLHILSSVIIYTHCKRYKFSHSLFLLALLFLSSPPTPPHRINSYGPTLMNMETFTNSKLSMTQFELKRYPAFISPSTDRNTLILPADNYRTSSLLWCRDKNNTKKTKERKIFSRLSLVIKTAQKEW